MPPCYHPISGFKSATGQFHIKLSQYSKESMTVPCGKCIGCKLDKARSWAIRCVHEASLYEDNAFITLTYDDSHLPPTGSLVKADFQNFMKRLRFHFGGNNIRFYQCGEYGDKNLRTAAHRAGLDVAFVYS